MILKRVTFTNFKNHTSSSFEFGEHLNCILGKNGTGKTNLLDGIYYLSFAKSGIGSSDRMAISFDEPAFTLFGNYDSKTIAVQFEHGKQKHVKVNGNVLEKLKELVGKNPLVMVLPDDTSMIRDGSDERRKFFDGALSQVNNEYLDMLLTYNKLLKQRNSILKQEQSIDQKLIETYDDQMIPLSQKISKHRSEIVKAFLPHLTKNYQDLHDANEVPNLTFKSHVDDAFDQAFRNNLPKDQLMQRTLLGCHRDDFEFFLDDIPIKKFGSQGQQKTFIISLKLALYDFLAFQKKEKPLLLLDDIFDKLDDSRIQLLVELLRDRTRFGQIFITDARKDRSKQLFNDNDEVVFIELAP